ncbi:MAG: hypothetical protein QME68_07480, partial [Elusimicrobiota bacterium]|nr:hypothetical protein [Elusimicrobiota bacterium]
MKKIFFVLLTTYHLLLTTYSLNASGTDPSAFLSFGTGARAFALAGAYSAIADDATATYYNSAALGILQYKEFLASYSQLWENTNYSFLAYAHPLLDRGAIGVNIVRLYSGGAEKRNEYNRSVGNRETFDNTKT